jgi:LemA protein
MLLWFIGFAAIALLAFVLITFNELIAARNGVRKAWSDIDVQLQRRYDLVPQLVAVVKGYAEHERGTLSAIAALRTRAQASASIAARGAIESELALQVKGLLALQERYPDLQASGNFLQLQRELVDVEDRVQSTRGAYNDAVLGYNTQIQNFPELLLAPLFGFRAADFFQAQDRAPVQVSG